MVFRVKLNKFCCCLSISFGAKMIGFAYVILCFIGFIVNINFLIKYYKPEYFTEKHIDSIDVGTSLFLVFGLYLLYGIYEETPSFIMAWIIFNWAIILVVLNELLTSTIQCMSYEHHYCKDLVKLLIVVVIVCAIIIYNGLIVSSLYQNYSIKRSRRIEKSNCRHDSFLEE